MRTGRRYAVISGLVMAALLTFGTGVQASPATPTVTVGFDGLSGDLVGSGDPADNPSWAQPDNTTDGEFSVAIKGARTMTLTGLDVYADNGAEWNTFFNDGKWALGVTAQRSTTLLNSADGTISISISRGRLALELHANDDGVTFVSGMHFLITATFSDSTTAAGSVTLP